ncbi:MAG TPA: CDP-alcohol phosphatidyltransferase family protein [Bryobacteraceae bacterium]|nr:CDP-alcohol phosphatidyltransferase family protein [Bryobacteraceae bacterium]
MPSLLNAANLLSLSRLVAVPWLVKTVLSGECALAMVLCLAAGATDFADGFVARKFGLESQLGAYLDPIADKSMLVSLYICFGIAGLAPNWLAALVVGRDVIIVLLAAAGMLFTRRRSFPPTMWGKLSTGVQIGACLVFLGGCAYGNWIGSLSLGTAQVAVATTAVISGLQYIGRAFQWARVTSEQHS